MIDKSREERLRAMRAEGDEDGANDDVEVWGGSDEEVCSAFTCALAYPGSII